MNLNKVNDKEKLEICRKYYLAGFAFLPFLWLVNFFWFYKHAFKRNEFPEQTQMKTYIIRSGIGCLVWLIILVIWNVLFQTFRVDWDSVGDHLTFILPSGRP
ncbi:gamma-secretase subunit pen-2 [Brachionus plicatilis]|uniref:Gamma-secretase subunit PEN-2 n=1 Tax=Brachionus plicatilis TaxID=10195 RepID=A0A3M7PNU3_BRAPC|nr:gamma-secretase subunit pen-2 [Brachionus plicatilis]